MSTSASELLHCVPAPAAEADSDLPEGFVVPTGWVIVGGRICRQEERANDVRVTPVSTGLIYPVSTGRDHDDAQVVDLAWRPFGRSRVVRTVDRGTAKDGRKLIAALGSFDLPFVSSNAKWLELWLAEIESANVPLIPEIRIARTLGWQPDGGFVTESTAEHPVRPQAALEDVQGPAVAAHRPCGTLKGWQAAIRPLAVRPRALVTLYAAFAAPLLRPLGVAPFILDVAGNSSRGKTTSARAAVSVWHDPFDGAAVTSWATTAYALEKRVNLSHGIPVLLDESQHARSKPELIEGIVYATANGLGKARSGGYVGSLRFETVVISTGEASLLTFTQEAGAAARVLSMEGAPFDALAATPAENAAAADLLLAGVKGNFGTAGPAFVARLREELARPGGLERLRERHDRLAQQHAEGSAIANRRAPFVAVLRLAGELARGFGIVPFDPPRADVWGELVGSNAQYDDRPARALDVVRELVAANPHRVHGLAAVADGAVLSRDYVAAPATGWLGFAKTVRAPDGSRVEAVCLFPQAVNDALDRAGINVSAVSPAWVESGAVLGQAGRALRVERCGPKTSKVYVFPEVADAAPSPGSKPAAPGAAAAADPYKDVPLPAEPMFPDDPYR